MKKEKEKGGKDGDAMMMEESRIKGASYAQCLFPFSLWSPPLVEVIHPKPTKSVGTHPVASSPSDGQAAQWVHSI